jgi:hypothetical protein
LRAVKAWWRRREVRRLPSWAGPTAESPETPRRWERHGDLLRITTESVGALRQEMLDVEATATARRLELVIRSWRAPWPTWSGRLGALPFVVHHEIRLPGTGTGSAAVRVELAAPAPLGAILAAMLPVLEPWRPLPASASPDLPRDNEPPRWLRAEEGWPRPAEVGPRYKILRPYDVRLAPSAEDTVDGAVLTRSAYGAGPADDAGEVVVDATTANPIGRQGYGPELPSGRLRLTGALDAPWWEISRPDDGAVVVAGRVGDPLTERQRGALTRLGTVTLVDRPAGIPPLAVAAALAQLAMTGVPLHVPDLGEDVAGRLAPDLVPLLRAPLPGRGADPMAWELYGIAQRRAALRHHASGFAWPRALASAYPSLGSPPTVSALLVTRRPRLVMAAVAAMTAQSYPALEVVVGLHGCDLPADVRARLGEQRMPVRVLPVPGERSLGEALAEATRLAEGGLVTKVDDDDRYGPEHIWDLVLARHYSGATVVGKGAEFVYLEARDLTVRRYMGSELFNTVVAGGTILLGKGDLENVGGWRPLPRSVDRGLLDRVLQDGGLVYRTHGFGFVYTRHGDGHTWDPGLDYFLHDPRQAWRGLPPYQEFGPA